MKTKDKIFLAGSIFVLFAVTAFAGCNTGQCAYNGKCYDKGTGYDSAHICGDSLCLGLCTWTLADLQPCYKSGDCYSGYCSSNSHLCGLPNVITCDQICKALGQATVGCVGSCPWGCKGPTKDCSTQCCCKPVTTTTTIPATTTSTKPTTTTTTVPTTSTTTIATTTTTTRPTTTTTTIPTTTSTKPTTTTIPATTTTRPTTTTVPTTTTTRPTTTTTFPTTTTATSTTTTTIPVAPEFPSAPIAGAILLVMPAFAYLVVKRSRG